MGGGEVQAMRARLLVQSDVLNLDEIERLVGRPTGGGGHRRGESTATSRRARLWAQWVLDLPTGGQSPMESLNDSLSNMSLFLATGMSTASRSGCDVRLCITQESSKPLEIALVPGALAWLSRADATLQTKAKPRAL